MAPKKSYLQTLSPTDSSNSHRLHRPPSYRRLSDSDNMFRRMISAPSHRRCKSDSGPSLLFSMNRSISPAGTAIKMAIRRTRSEGRLLKEFMLNASSWLEGLSHINANSRYGSELGELDESLSMQSCEDDSWTEIVRDDKKEVSDTESITGPASILSSESRPTSPLKKFFTEAPYLEPIDEVEDPGYFFPSQVGHRPPTSCHCTVSVGEESQSRGGCVHTEAVYHPLNLYQPSPKIIRRRGTPSKPHVQATGYLKRRSSHSSSGLIGESVASGYEQNYRVLRSKCSGESLGSALDEFGHRSNPTTSHSSSSTRIRFVNMGEPEVESSTLSRLPRVEPSEPCSSPYVGRRTLKKDYRNVSSVMSLSQPRPTPRPTSHSSHDKGEVFSLSPDERGTSYDDYHFGSPVGDENSRGTTLATRFSLEKSSSIGDFSYLDQKQRVCKNVAYRSDSGLPSSSLDRRRHTYANENDPGSCQMQPEAVMSGLIQIINERSGSFF